MAIAVDGTVVINVAHVDGERDPAALLRRALVEGGRLFIGVQLSPGETAEALRWLGNGGAEVAGHVLGVRNRRRRGKRAT